MLPAARAPGKGGLRRTITLQITWVDLVLEQARLADPLLVGAVGRGGEPLDRFDRNTHGLADIAKRGLRWSRFDFDVKNDGSNSATAQAEPCKSLISRALLFTSLRGIA
jgi:hypothetical protein